jgi:hypothetical protein
MAEIELAISKSRVQFVTLHYSFWAEIWCIFLGCIFVGVFIFLFPTLFRHTRRHHDCHDLGV